MIVETFNELKTEVIKTTWKFNNSDKEYILSWDVCKSPFCGCTKLKLTIGFENSLQDVSFSYDVMSKKISSAGSDGIPELVRLFKKEMSEIDHALLNQIFHTKKIKNSNECDLGDFEPPFFSIEEIEYEALMVNYGEIFPWSQKHWFEFEGITYFLSEYYCLKSGCKCNDVTIEFIAIKDAININEKDPTSVNFNYRTGKWEINEQGKGTPKCAVLISQMNKKYPDVKKTLADRKAKLMQLYRRYKEIQGPIDRNKPVTIDAQCGRNDPCYCGSGKKFKKCCGK